MPVSRVLAIVALLLTLACSEREPQPKWPFRPYRGRLSQDVRLPALYDAVDDALGPAAERVTKNLGIAVAPKAFRYRYVDWEREPEGTAPRGRTVRYQGSTPELELQIEPLLFGIAEPIETLAHEMAHGALLLAIPRHQSLPGWLQEGLAVVAADQTRRKMDAAAVWSECSTHDARARDLPERVSSWTDYAEAGSAVELIRERGGPASLHELVRRLAAGEPHRSAIEQITQMSWLEFVAAARERMRRESRRNDASTRRLCSAREAIDARRYRDALVLLGPLFGWRDQPSYPAALYYGGLAHLGAGDWGMAAARFDELLATRRTEMRHFRTALTSSAQAHARLGNERLARDRERDAAAFSPRPHARARS